MDCTSGFGPVPTATIATSSGISNSEPSTGTGRRRPESSGSPSAMRMQRAPRSQPFSSPRNSTGWVRVWISTPSSFAWWTSSARPGISASDRR